MQNNNTKSEKRRFKGIVVLFTIPLQFIVAACISCFLVFYDPFATVRKYVVETAMSTYSHQYLAKMFFIRFNNQQNPERKWFRQSCNATESSLRT